MIKIKRGRIFNHRNGQAELDRFDSEAQVIGKNQCSHGQLTRACLICEYESQLKAADRLADTVTNWNDGDVTVTVEDIHDSINEYRRLRGIK